MIFATIWNDTQMNVMLDQDGIRTSLDHAPGTCEPVRWGTRLAAAAVNLAHADRPFLADLLTDAWEGKAPRRLLADR
jgi:hypothetical protein